MILHDYTNLLEAIDELKEAEELAQMKQLQMKELELKKMELEIEKSGILKDWNQLKEACKKVDVRLCPFASYDENAEGYMMTGGEYFTDRGYFMQCMSSGSHWSDYFGFDGNSGKIVWKVIHITSSHLFTGFKDKELEVTKKIELLNLFLILYEEYKNVQLNRVFVRMQKLSDKLNKSC